MANEQNLTGNPDSAGRIIAAGSEIPVVPPDVVAFGDPDPPEGGGGLEGDPEPPDSGTSGLGGPQPPAGGAEPEGDPEPPDGGGGS